MSCIAIIKTGPRRGQQCGRLCRRPYQYCDQYHLKLPPLSPIRLAPQQDSPETKHPNQFVYNMYYDSVSVLPQPPRQIQPSLPFLSPPLSLPQETKIQKQQLQKEEPINRAAQKQIMYELLGTNASTLLHCLCCILQRGQIKCRDYTDDCSICTSEARTDEYWAVTPCNHCFHAECLRDWIKTFQHGQDKGCPLCRTAIKNRIKKGFIVS